MAKKQSPKRVILLFLVYSTVLNCLVLGVLYTVAQKMQPTTIAALVLGCFVVAAIATIVHLRTGKKNTIDGIVDRMP